MKIAIVCGHFIPSMGYIEVYLAKEYTRLGHTVNVFTTAKVPSYVRSIIKEEYSEGVEKHPELGYAITRLHTKYEAGQMVIAKGLKKAVDEFQADEVVIIGLGKLFPKPLLKGCKRNYRLSVLLGDNEDNHEPSKAKAGIDTVKKWLKNPMYKLAVKNADALYPYTPETNDIVKRIIPASMHGTLDKKTTEISLGFDTDKFFYSNEDRRNGRAKIGLGQDEKMMVTATRIIAHKRLEDVIDAVDAINEAGQKLHYVIIGFADDDYGQEVKEYIATKKHSDRFHCFPFMSHLEIREMYQAADIAYFPTTVISIFEALGTGLPVVLPWRKSVSHIVSEDENGWYVQDGNLLPILTKSCETLDKGWDRPQKAKLAENEFSYSSIVKKMLCSE